MGERRTHPGYTTGKKAPTDEVRVKKTKNDNIQNRWENGELGDEPIKKTRLNSRKLPGTLRVFRPKNYKAQTR